jgi:thiol-disulfide isomerase/thioredoxin
VLLDFSSPYCGPCKELEPTIDRLASEGFPVRKVDVTRDRALAAEYRVSQVPCLVMLADGREVKRLIGGADYRSLRALIEQHTTAKPAATSPASRGGTPPQLTATWGSDSAPAHATALTSPSGTEASPAPIAHIDPAGFDGKLLSATVRLKVADAGGFGYGTGTIVDTKGNHALIATCGHLFRDSAGKGTITVELFRATPNGPQVIEQLPGRLESFDDKRDVGFVSIATTQQVGVCRVAPQASVQENDRVFSVGCSRGDNPSIDRTRVTSVHHNHVNAAHRPVEGRSGGGLFNEQGQLVGICTGAYQETDEGLYAGLSSIHGELDRLGYSFVYKNRDPVAQVSPPADTSPQLAPIPQPNIPAVAAADAMPATMQPPAPVGAWPAPAAAARTVSHEASLSPIEGAALEEIAQRAIDSEVVVVIRPKQPGGRSEILTLERVSPQFVEQLRRLQTSGGGNRLAAQP